MRISPSALATVVLTVAFPAIGPAQVLTPFAPNQREHPSLSHVVPVATVNLKGDAVTLEQPRDIQGEIGDSFVLGSAVLDLRNPSEPWIDFALTNSSRAPIPWNAIEFSVWRAAPVPVEQQVQGAPDVLFCTLGKKGLASAPDAVWQPGLAVNVRVPIGGDCLRRTEAAEPLAFLVFAGHEMPHPDLQLGPSDPGWERVSTRRKAMLRSALESVTSGKLGQ